MKTKKKKEILHASFYPEGQRHIQFALAACVAALLKNGTGQRAFSGPVVWRKETRPGAAGWVGPGYRAV